MYILLSHTVTRSLGLLVDVVLLAARSARAAKAGGRWLRRPLKGSTGSSQRACLCKEVPHRAWLVKLNIAQGPKQGNAHDVDMHGVAGLL